MRRMVSAKTWAGLLALMMILASVEPGEVRAQEPGETRVEAREQELGLKAFSQEIRRMKAFDREKTYIPEEDQSGARKESCSFQTCRLIVKVKGELADTGAAEVAGPFHDIYILQYKTPEEAAAALTRYRRSDQVEFVQEDRVHSARALMGTGTLETARSRNTGFALCGFAKLQKKILARYKSQEQVPSVTVAVLDTGVDYDHEAIQGRLAANGYNAAEGFRLFDWRSDLRDLLTPLPRDDFGHGTAVASIITMTTPEYVRILPIKVSAMTYNSEDDTAEPSLDDSDIYLGIQYAIKAGADVVNMSFGGYELEMLTREYLNDCAEAQIPVVSAYGNERVKTNEMFPACYPGVVGVSSVNDDGTFSADFSNYGPSVDIAAPGRDVYAAKLGGGYEKVTGTSFSTPYVSAALALAKAYFPEATAEQLADYVLESAQDLGPKGWDERFGYGMLQLSDCGDSLPVRSLLGPTKKASEEERSGAESAERSASGEAKTSQQSQTDSAAEVFEEKVEAPSAVSLKNTRKGVWISWKKAKGAVGYRVYRKKAKGSWESLSSVSEKKSFLDRKAVSGTGYRYRVVAYSVSGKKVWKDSESWIWLKPSAITGVKQSKSSVSLKFKKIAGISGYQLLYSTNAAFTKAVKRKNTTRAQKTIKRLKKKKYYAKVRTCRKVGGKVYYSAWSRVKRA